MGIIGLIKRARGCELMCKKNIPTLHSGGISSSWSLLYEYLDFNGKMNGEMKFSPCMSMS